MLWSWNWPFNTLENLHGKNELDLGKTLISINSLNYIKLLNKIFNANPHNFTISWNSSFSISMHSVSNLLQYTCITHCVDITCKDDETFLLHRLFVIVIVIEIVIAIVIVWCQMVINISTPLGFRNIFTSPTHRKDKLVLNYKWLKERAGAKQD